MFKNRSFASKIESLRGLSFSIALLCAVAGLSLAPVSSRAQGSPQRLRFDSGSRYLVLEILEDGLLHFEVSENSSGPNPNQGIYTTPMVEKKNFNGPEQFKKITDFDFETKTLRIEVDKSNLCFTVTDLAQQKKITAICGDQLNQNSKQLVIYPNQMKNVYGVGNFFRDPNTADGDWNGQIKNVDGFGNVRMGFHGAAPSQSQFPMIYALGSGNDCFALFIDNVYGRSWNFTNPDVWTTNSFGDQLRGYVFTGPSVAALRQKFMELVGKPLVPPRSTFGLWLSKFGYENWNQIYDDVHRLRSKGFPVDGIGMDIQWFGGRFGDNSNGRMGSLSFDPQNFPNAASQVKNLRVNEGIRLMTIEESYVDSRLPDEGQALAATPAGDCFFAHRDASSCNPVQLNDGNGNPMWWGMGGMLDWTDPAARAYWHKTKRQKLAELGIVSHWLDLGEPEPGLFDANAYYHGLEGLPSKNRHADIHNLFSLEWIKGVYEGYNDAQNQKDLENSLSSSEPPRFFSMSRAGAPGIQRYGAGMWSGDIGRNMGSLRAHLNTQMNMSMLGVDYYNSDVGGFTDTNGVGIEAGNNDPELFTQWFASSSLGEVPLRPHGWALGNGMAFTPDLRGHLESNRANLKLRYSLLPYYNSLAHRAHLYGEPMFPPLFYYNQADLNARRLGNVKMIGPNLLYGIVANFGQTERRVYLPKGNWINFHSNEWVSSSGAETPEWPVYISRDGQDGIFTLPLFAREGSIIPKMLVDDKTMNIVGKRSDGSIADDLVLRIYSSSTPTTYTVYEDDGESTGYLQGQLRTTVVSQVQKSSVAQVDIAAADGSFNGAKSARSYRIELGAQNQVVTGVRFDGQPLTPCNNLQELETTQSGCWINSNGLVFARSSKNQPVGVAHQFQADLQTTRSVTSAHFVCENGNTAQGQSIFVTGNIPQLGSWDAKKAIPLTATRYPTWTKVIGGLTTSTNVEWKCLRKWGADDGSNSDIESGSNHSFTTSGSGFTGTFRGRF